MRSIFVNLPVADVATSRAFFGALGFTVNEQFSDDSTACLVIEQNVFAMLQTTERFGDFVVGEIADAQKTTEVLLALSADSREEVDRLKAAALAHGGGEWKEAQDHGFMYGCSFTDPDGHVWEVVWMDPAVASGEKDPS
ncbi:VOC family protein [Actinomycetospora lemnae]|uniref:VOC family protein n=1 Tax=Actinomycetospora lemnae TaxID=3019891 RepID=A0ABT5SPT7_9PSEU|nr:VOC family protein [Actinomycetospora sp. DW7H6]MDD7964856.1 VOC family protein [Actinomycetospora sp. DW7H6]